MNVNNFFVKYPVLLDGIIQEYQPLWNALDVIKDIILKIAAEHNGEFEEHENLIFIGRNVNIAKTACIVGPALIGSGCEIRPGAYLREYVILCEKCTIGNSTEVKNSILFDDVEIPHFNYVGDSILGNHSHLGAGVKVSNKRNDKGEISVKDSNGIIIPTGRKKFGAIIGDNTQIGCNSVINPGTLLEKNVIAHALSNIWGYHSDGVVIRSKVSL